MKRPLIALALLLPGPLPCAAAPDPGPAPALPAAADREESRTRALNAWYRESDHWALSGIVLTAFGERWHPIGAESVLAALKDKDERLHAYAVEALWRTDLEVLRMVLSRALVEQLVNKSLSEKNEHFHQRALVLLSAAFPEAGADDKSSWRSWWRRTKKEYVPAEWIPEELEIDMAAAGRTVAGSVVERAFDLHTAGMELAFVIDSTGSMQTTIDAARDALGDIAALLAGIAPGLRVGVVEYRDSDRPDIYPEANVVIKLDDDVEKVQKRLGTLLADGGGDFPESVQAGMELAFRERLGWERSANKLLVVIGDAPPHDDELEHAKELARKAYETPFGEKATEIVERREKGRSSSRRAVRPFVTSAIAVGTTGVSNETSSAFRAIAEAGGGAYAEVLTEGSGAEATPSKRIVKHILRLSFGSRWVEQIDRFVDVYLTYREAGYFD